MERKKMAGPEGKEDKRSSQFAQQAEQTTRQAAQTAADVSGRAAAIGVEIVKRNNENAQQLWEASTQMATELTHRATDQFGRAFGLSGDEAQNVLADTSKNLAAVLDSTNAITSASQEFSRQWIETTQKILETTISRCETLARCHTPQEFFGMQGELARDNLNTALHGTRSIIGDFGTSSARSH
jgi:small-conductance mechanosensitive channel